MSTNMIGRPISYTTKDSLRYILLSQYNEKTFHKLKPHSLITFLKTIWNPNVYFDGVNVKHNHNQLPQYLGIRFGSRKTLTFICTLRKQQWEAYPGSHHLLSTANAQLLPTPITALVFRSLHRWILHSCVAEHCILCERLMYISIGLGEQ